MVVLRFLGECHICILDPGSEFTCHTLSIRTASNKETCTDDVTTMNHKDHRYQVEKDAKSVTQVRGHLHCIYTYNPCFSTKSLMHTLTRRLLDSILSVAVFWYSSTMSGAFLSNTGCKLQAGC